VKVAEKSKQSRTQTVTKAIYATGWDGTAILPAPSYGYSSSLRNAPDLLHRPVERFDVGVLEEKAEALTRLTLFVLG
jgi:hypothetical protein